MNGLDPIAHLKVAQTPPDSKLGCPVCKTHFAARDGYIFLTHWHAENEQKNNSPPQMRRPLRNGIPFSSECGLINRRRVRVIRGC